MSQSNFNEKDQQVTRKGNRKDAKNNVDETADKIKEDKYAALAQELESNEVPEEYRYLVRGAVLKCSCGSHTRKLNLPKSHGVYIGDNPMVNKADCAVGDDQNIPTFGVCESEGNPCRKSLGEKLRDGLISSFIPGAAAVVVARDEAEKILLAKEDGTNVRGYPCTPCIISEWQNAYEESWIVSHSGGGDSDMDESSGQDGALHSGGGLRRTGDSAALTEQSFLICAYGGLIEPVTSGQENTDTKWIPNGALHSSGKSLHRMDSDTDKSSGLH